MAYRKNDSGCGCMFFAALFLVAALVSGIRGCVNGDIKMPRLGSSRVSGGSGGYGTSNGYNVKYKQTTSPNYNSSSNDYTHTNSQPTEYKDNNSNRTNTSSSTENYNPMPQSGTHSSNLDNTSNTSSLKSLDAEDIIIGSNLQYVTCPDCNGDGRFYRTWSFTGGNGNLCAICLRDDAHEHTTAMPCPKCKGSGTVPIGR